VLAGSGKVEGELDEVGALGVGGDRGDLAAVDVFVDVEVAGAGGAVGAAIYELALMAQLDLFAIPARAEGVDTGHDREQQEPLGAVVDALDGGLQLRAAALDLTEQPEGVALLASYP
jgi:hypothetical protein